ncbi:class I SAM-dependent methyltransferase [bacterium]|nr:class I SAM-dependent methyltransferase [bacterium]
MSIIDTFDNITQQTLKELEKTQHDFWNISRVTAEFLYNFIVDGNIKNVIEIGTSNGYSGIWLGKALKKNGGQLTTIEFYEKRIVLAQNNFKKCGVSDVIEIKQGDASTVLEYLSDDFMVDLAFVDACKKQYIDFFHLIDPHLNVGGYLACDNVISHAQKVQPFLEEIDKYSNYENVVLPLPAGLSLGKKIRG